MKWKRVIKNKLKMLRTQAHNLLQNNQQVAVVVAQVALFQELEVLLVVLQVGLEVWLEVR